MRGLSAAVVGLVAVTSLRIMRGSLRGARAAAIALLTFVAVGPLRLPTVGVVLVVTPVSFGLYPARPPAHTRRCRPLRRWRPRDGEPGGAHVDLPLAELPLRGRRPRGDPGDGAAGGDRPPPAQPPRGPRPLDAP